MDNAIQERTTARNHHPNSGRTPKTTLSAKHQGKYGKPEINNVGVFQSSAIIDLLFIIYLEDMMEDYQSLNRQAELPTSKELRRTHQINTQKLLQEIKTSQTQEQKIPDNKGKTRQTPTRQDYGQAYEKHNTHNSPEKKHRAKKT